MRVARDVMQKPVITLSATLPVTEAARILVDNGISGCPVLDHREQVVGVISRTNLIDYSLSVEGGALTPMVRVLIPTADGVEVEEAFAPISEDFEVPTVRDVMTTEVISVEESAPIDEVAGLMAMEHVHRVPVMRDRKLVGIITTMDLMRAFGRIPKALG